MTSSERRLILNLATIMALRMIGLFIMLPVFSLYAIQLQGGTPLLVGFAMGSYGLTQAFFQIPFGALSDRLGRKSILAVGLLFFILGSLLATFAHHIYLMIIARALQGTGAIGGVALAAIADATSEKVRTKAMAIAGITIGVSFTVAILLGPLLAQWLTLSHFFGLATCLGMIALLILSRLTLPPGTPAPHPSSLSFWYILRNPYLMKLNMGIFFLHAIFTAIFVILPISFYDLLGLQAKDQWIIYLPTLLIGFIVSFICIISAEKKQKVNAYFKGALAILIIAYFFLWATSLNIYFAVIGLSLFFSSFSLLEAFLPSMISKAAPASSKGTALGIYSSSQFLGIFVGGASSGLLYGQFGFSGVYSLCLTLTFFWLIMVSVSKHSEQTASGLTKQQFSSFV